MRLALGEGGSGLGFRQSAGAARTGERGSGGAGERPRRAVQSALPPLPRASRLAPASGTFARVSGSTKLPPFV